MASVSKKFDILRQCGYNWFGEPVRPRVISMVNATLEEVTQDILREMDNPQRKFRLPSPSDKDLSPIATDKLNALILRLMKRSKHLNETLKELLK